MHVALFAFCCVLTIILLQSWCEVLAGLFIDTVLFWWGWETGSLLVLFFPPNSKNWQVSLIAQRCVPTN